MSTFWTEIISATFGNEASVETRLILPLLEALGYEKSDISPKHRIIFQEGKTGRPHEADFVVFYGSNHNKQTSLIVIEAKTPGESFDDAKSQAESYVANMRAPIYLLSDGIRFSVWQLQLTQESECVIDEPVSSLPTLRGKIESLLSKEAMFAYCKTLTHKTLQQANTNFGAYITNELHRVSKFQLGVARTLTGNSSDASETFNSSNLCDLHEGAIIVGSSGFGKSTLALSIYSQILDAAWANSDSRLPFDIQLPELVESKQNLLTYLAARLSAHCPFVTESALKDTLRDRGAILICDGFDRIAASERNGVQIALKTTLRDFPKLQIFVFSRQNARPDMPIPTLQLDELTPQQQHEFRMLANRDAKHPEVMWHLPEVLSNLCWHPLLLQLITSYLIRHHRPPNGIAELFDSWLSTLLLSSVTSATTYIDREKALSLIAMATIDKPLTASAAIELLKQNDISANLHDELIACDAIVVAGRTVEVLHESLADYLRAMELVSLEETAMMTALESVALRIGSLFPILLMSLLPTRTAQRLLWERLAQLDLATYLNALRFQADIFLDNAKLSADELARNYLEDILDGITQPLNAFFSTLRPKIIEITGGSEGGNLAIAGTVSAPALVSYQIGVLDVHFKDRINVGKMIENHYPIFGLSLDLSKTRIDSGREIGAAQLAKSLLKLVKTRQLLGGPTFINERIIGRLRLLNRNFDHPDFGAEGTLETVEASLLPFADQIVAPELFRERWEPFFISELIQDVQYLRQQGLNTLDQWWLAHGGMKHRQDMTDDEIRHLLNEHYRRVQIAYTEVVKESFGQLAHKLWHFPLHPARWNLTIVPSNRHSGIPTIYFSWLPTEKWSDAGADVKFSELPPQLDFEAEWASIVSALKSLGRPTDRGLGSGFCQLPVFDGSNMNGFFDGETSVMREVADMLTKDIKDLFKELPASHSIGF